MRAIANMRSALPLNLAVLGKELRTRMRGRRAMIIITLYLLLLAIAGGLVLEVQRTSLQFNFNPATAANTGMAIFTTLAILQLALLVFIVPGLTGAAIAGERDRQTLDLLLSTQVSSVGIVLGKLLSSLSYILLLLVAALPVFSLAFLFGGVSPRQIGLVFLISLSTALALGSIGVVLSTWLRRGQMATIAAYATTFALILGTWGANLFTVASSGGRGGTAVPLVLNPFVALIDVLHNIPTPVFGGGSAGFPFWQANLIANAVIVLVCTLLSIQGLRPRRRSISLPRFRRRTAVEAEA